MSNTPKGLGRGLNALFNNSDAVENGEKPEAAKVLHYIKLEDLQPSPNQPRKTFNSDSLEDLANSIRIKGVLQPILVRPAEEEGKYYIIAGERRWRASKLAGMEEIPAIIKDYTSNEAIIATMMENMHRDNLNPLEEAKGLAHIMDVLAINQSELANALGAQRGTISNLLRILRLSPQAKDDLMNNRITHGHARCLVTLPESESENLRQRIIDVGMSVRATEMALSFWNQTKKFPWDKTSNAKPVRVATPNMKKLAEDISIFLNCDATIRGTAEKGKINLTYESNDQLCELLEKFGLSDKDVRLSEEK